MASFIKDARTEWVMNDPVVVGPVHAYYDYVTISTAHATLNVQRPGLRPDNSAK